MFIPNERFLQKLIKSVIMKWPSWLLRNLPTKIIPFKYYTSFLLETLEYY